MFHQLRQLADIILILLSVSLLFACAQPATTPAPAPTPDQPVVRPWMDIELTDVATGETFKISDFEGKSILLESFAVWCPTCLAQQKELQKLQPSEGDDVIHISLDTDPNEDTEKVREHIQRYGLDWYFAVSPIELTQALIDEFGLDFVSAPRAPVVLICKDGSARFLRSGVKPVEELAAEVAQGCE